MRSVTCGKSHCNTNSIYHMTLQTDADSEGADVKFVGAGCSKDRCVPSCADVTRETMTGHALITRTNSWRAFLCLCVCVRERGSVCVSISAVCCNKFVQLVSLSGSVVTGDKRDEDTFI